MRRPRKRTVHFQNRFFLDSISPLVFSSAQELQCLWAGVQSRSSRDWFSDIPIEILKYTKFPSPTKFPLAILIFGIVQTAHASLAKPTNGSTVRNVLLGADSGQGQLDFK